MKRIVVSLSIIISLILTGVIMLYFKQSRKHPEPKGLVAKFASGKEGKGLGEFAGLTGLIIKEDYLYVADSGNHRVQALEIKY